MRVLLAFDKFKGAIPAREACGVAAEALASGGGGWSSDQCPLTDGGEGFAEILTSAAGGKLHTLRVAGPRGARVTAHYGLVRVDQIPGAARVMLDLRHLQKTAIVAVIEMAQASGLALLPENRRDPWATSTRGTGRIFEAAIAAGAQGILLGVGGSATHDLGLGALSALGFKFRRGDGRVLRAVEPTKWPALARVTAPPRASFPPIWIACDVTNPLLGPRGAAKIYGPQKGLRSQDFARLEHETVRMAAILRAHSKQPRSMEQFPGAGAAGGLAFGLMCVLRAKMLPGFDLITAWLGLERRMKAADMIITGEGRFDESSFNGKGPGSVVERGLQLRKAVHVFTGRTTPMPLRKGLQIHVITPRGQKLAQALRDTGRNLALSVRETFAVPAELREASSRIPRAP